MPNQQTQIFDFITSDEFDDYCDNVELIDEIEDVIAESDTTHYWQLALDVVNGWAKYQSVKKLYVNATHEETRHRVWPVVSNKKYYDGSTKRVHNREQELYRQLKWTLSEFESLCRSYGVEPVSLDWLYHNLKEAKDYASYRGKCQRRLNRAKPAVSLKEL